MDLTLLAVLFHLLRSSLQMPDESVGRVKDAASSLESSGTGTTEEDVAGNMRKLLGLQPKNLVIPMFSLPNPILDPISSLSIWKREINQDFKSENDESKEFIEDRLAEQSQALQQLMKMVQKNEKVTQQLVENLSKQLVQPKIPEKLEEPKHTRRSNTRHNFNAEKDNPLVRLGKNVPKYGSLIKHLVEKEIQGADDPKPLLEVVTSKTGEAAPIYRRSHNGPPSSVQNNISNDNKVVSWCKNAVLCHKTNDPLCGYDDNFGKAKFENLCHLFEVNCYWKYSFSLVSCKPLKIKLL